MTSSLARAADRFIHRGLTGYDACYVTLAEELGAVWLTFDEEACARLQDPRLACLVSRGLPEGWK